MTREHQPVTYFSRLDADECWALLADAEIGRIAWLGDDGISILPINFGRLGFLANADTDGVVPLVAEAKWGKSWYEAK